MSIQKTCFEPGNFYHIYNRAVKDNLLFRKEDNYRFFLSKVEMYLQTSAEILAYCLMPNHYHLLIKLMDSNLSRSMQQLALSYVVSFNRVYNRSGHLFQGRYQIKLVDDFRYLLHLSRYIHLNPLTGKLVKNALDWKFSSIHDYVKDVPESFVKPGLILDILDENRGSSKKMKQQDYLRFINDCNRDPIL
jgi:REP element-mobilizing transposase RayT